MDKLWLLGARCKGSSAQVHPPLALQGSCLYRHPMLNGCCRQLVCVYIACRLWPPEALLTGLRDLPALSLTQVPGPDFESDPTYSPEPVLAVPLVAGLDIDNDMTTRATLCVLVCYQNVTFSDIICHANILELDEGINLNAF